MVPQTPPKLVFIVVTAISLLAAMGMASLCTGIFVHVYADASVMTAVMTLTSGLVGALSSILVSARATPVTNDTTETTTTSTTTSGPPTPTEPIPVTIENPESNPAKVKEVKL